MPIGSYQAALDVAQKSGQAGRIIPSGGAAGQIKYKFVPSGGSAGVGGFDYQSLRADFQKREKGARESNLAREAEIRGTYDEIINQSQGAFRQAGLADIEQAKTTAVGAGTQQLISSGLFGTTTAASLPVQAENQAARSRLKLEDIIQQRTTEAKLGKAGFVERIDQPYPDYNLLVQAMIAQGKS